MGAALVGCSQDGVMATLGCNPVCAAALPLPRESADINSHCPQMVITASNGDDGLSIDVLRHGSTDSAFLFIDTPHFTGFDDDERERLADLAPTFDVYLGLDTPTPVFKDIQAKTLPMRSNFTRGIMLAMIIGTILLFVAFFASIVAWRQLQGAAEK